MLGLGTIMPFVAIRYTIPNTEQFVEALVEYDESTTILDLKPRAHEAINQELVSKGYPSLREIRLGRNNYHRVFNK